MYTELLPGDQSLALIINSLTEHMAGTYYCGASYANTEPLEINVKVSTYGKFAKLFFPPTHLYYNHLKFPYFMIYIPNFVFYQKQKAHF